MAFFSCLLRLLDASQSKLSIIKPSYFKADSIIPRTKFFSETDPSQGLWLYDDVPQNLSAAAQRRLAGAS